MSAADARDGGDAPALVADALLAGPGARALVGVSGPDHRDWIERIASAPLRDLPPGRFRRATLMDGKGRLRAEMRVVTGGPDGGLLLEVPGSHAAALLKLLDMYVLRDKVTLHDMTASHALLSVLGPRAGAVLTDAGLPVAAPAEAAGAAEGAVVRDDGTLALPSFAYGLDGTDLVLEAARLPEAERRLLAAGAVRATPEELDAVRVARGVPWFSADLADGVIPLEAGLDALVSITKGCYPGQEVVARILNLGQVARKLMRLTAVSGRPEPGDALLGTGERAGKEAGRLTSVAVAADGVVHALGFLRRPFWPAGTRVMAGEAELEVAGEARA